MLRQRINCYFETSFAYTTSYEKVYTCLISNENIFEDELEFIGYHDVGKSNIDVTAVSIIDCTCTRIPQQLPKIFPNLKMLKIFNSKLKQIKRDDLKDLCQLEALSISSNDITFLPDDLLKDMKNLEILFFKSNNIKIMEPNLLNGLNKLRYVNLCSNPCIDMLFDLINNRGNTLEEIKQAIRQKYLSETSAKLKLKNGISSDLNRVILNDKLKDFIVKVEGEIFKVHKFLLAARSPVLSQMIEQNIDAEELSLDNISTETFRVILNFIYTDELPESNAEFVYLFMAADKLRIDKLKDFCAEKLIEKINVENAFDMLTLANKYEHERLREISFEQVKKILGNDNINEELAKET